ncbi:MAG: tetratricopeptide repeat protein [Puniceicoccales bacterium]|nr:tetratricopeptide repeat protein [Puniceicoccales bacterium]
MSILWRNRISFVLARRSIPGWQRGIRGRAGWMLQVALMLLAVPPMFAQQTPLPVLEENVPLPSANDPVMRNRFAAADEALASGLTTLASGFFTRLSLEFPQGGASHERAQLGLATCLLARNDPDGAAKILERLPQSAPRQIRLALARAIMGTQTAGDGDALNALNPALLSASDLPWYHIARALFALATDSASETQTEFIRTEFTQARASYSDAAQHYQAQHVRALEYLAQIRLGPPPDAAVLNELRNSVATNENNPLGFIFAKQLAIALAKNKRTAEAVAILRQRSFISPAERDEADLLTGYILGAGNSGGRQALYNVISNKAPPPLQNLALSALATAPASGTAGNPPAEIYEKLTIHAATAPDPRTLDMLNLVRATLAYAANDLPGATRAANDLLENTPESPLRSDALRILATVAWQNNEPRRAAGHLTQLQQLLTGPAQTRTALVAADCLYVSARIPAPNPSAYPLAAAAYAAVQPRLPTPEERGNTLYLRLQCELRTGNATAATALLKAAAIPPGIDTDSLLHCEWSLIEWLRNNGEAPAARARLDALLAMQGARMDTTHRIRFLWQQALLALAADDTAQAIQLAAQITAIMEKLPPSAPPALLAQTRAILSKTILLKARAMLPSDPVSAHAILNELRRKYPDEEATAASYLLEGRSHAARGDYSQALRILATAHQRYPRHLQPPLSDYGAEALYEIAQQHIAQSQSGTSSQPYRQAIEALEKFATDYPRHPLADAAKLQQADLFRITANFADALAIYEQLLTRLPDNTPRRWRAELARADCLYAKATLTPATRDTDLNLAIDAYDRLFSLPHKSSDLKAEAGCKWGNALAARRPDPQAGGRAPADIAREADEARWKVITQLLKAPGPDAPLLGANARYWTARTLMNLADSSKARNDNATAATLYRLLLDYNNDVQNTPGRRLPFQNIAWRELSQLPRIPPAEASPVSSAPGPSPSPSLTQ